MGSLAVASEGEAYVKRTLSRWKGSNEARRRESWRLKDGRSRSPYGLACPQLLLQEGLRGETEDYLTYSQPVAGLLLLSVTLRNNSDGVVEPRKLAFPIL